MYNVYDTNTLLGVMREFAPVNSYWLDLCFPGEMTFDSEYIDFEKLFTTRKLAPFVSPIAQGVPIYGEGSTLTRLKPAYIKPRDPVRPDRMIRRRPGELATPGQMSPAQRWNAVVADIIRTHREAIERRWEWMAAQAVLHGAVVISGPDYPERHVDFGRDPSQTKTLTGATAWNGAGADPIADINNWRTATRQLKFGGALTRITCGAQALEALINNPKVKEQLDTQVRGTAANLNRGVRSGLEAEYIGTLGSGLEVWSYQDYFEDENGAAMEIMDPRDVVLTGNVEGIRAFGAILDKRAGLQALPMFPKMWDVEDPSATNIMTQSAPLPVPGAPNRTMRARVIDTNL